MSQRTLQVSFSGGEQSPFMGGRIDDEKYRAGASKMRNFIASPQGPVYNRAGFSFVREVKDSQYLYRLFPFAYSVTDTLVIEAGPFYFRFIKNGAYVLSGTPAAYNGATAYVIGDMVTSGGNKYYCILATTGNIPPNATYWYLMPSDVYEIPTPYATLDLQRLRFVQSGDIITFTDTGYATRELRRYGATNWQLALVSFAPSLSAPGGVGVVATVGAGATTYSYKVSTIGNNGLDESYPSGSVNCTNNLLVSGNYNTVSWSAATGAKRYNIYKESNGLYGYIGQTDGLSFKDDNILSDVSKTPPETNSPFATYYPQAVCYFDQRRVFGGRADAVQDVYMTKTFTESNMSYSIPSRDDDYINFKIASRETNTIKHLIPLNDLIVLTDSAEWRVSSSGGALTPSDISVKAQSYVGANDARPAAINNNVIYCAARGGHATELIYDGRSQTYYTDDLSIRAAHLFDGYEIKEIAYSKSPQKICWMVSTSGKLLGITYDPNNVIRAWHQHDTDGTFESIACVAEGSEDYLYAIIKRTINGVTKRYVERMASRAFSTQADAFFVDCGATYYKTGTFSRVGTVMTCTIASHGFANGLSYHFWFSDTSFGAQYDGAEYVVTVLTADTFTIVVANAGATSGNVTQSVITLSGLSYLEGKTVSILTEGSVHPQKVVTGGVVTLDYYASKIQIGLPIQADLKTLPISMQIDAAFSIGRWKNVNKVIMNVYQSGGIFAGPSEDDLVEYKQRTTEIYGSPPALKTGLVDVTIPPNWNGEGTVFIRQDSPLPLTILSMTLDVAVGG
jgi:hypothetical protein